jgi:hypothetical protein
VHWVGTKVVTIPEVVASRNDALLQNTRKKEGTGAREKVNGKKKSRWEVGRRKEKQQLSVSDGTRRKSSGTGSIRTLPSAAMILAWVQLAITGLG